MTKGKKPKAQKDVIYKLTEPKNGSDNKIKMQKIKFAAQSN